MEIITLHEAQQAAEMRKPLWPLYSTHPHCNGPCQHGRSLCMTPEACQTGQHEDEEFADKPPMTRADALLAGGLVLVCWGAVAVVLLAFGVRL